MEGLVIKSTGNRITVRQADGLKVECRLKGQFRVRGIRSTNPLAIGDRVIFEKPAEENIGLITKILQRDNYIIRKATKLSKESHIIGANIDRAFLIVTLINPRTSTGFIDRFLVTATGYYIPACIVFNKKDLYNETLSEQEKELCRIYEFAGYPCFSVSVLRGENINQVSNLLQGKISLFSGHSGSGKSALIMAIDPTLHLKTGDISETHLKGKHTTTFTEMYELSTGGYIIDTPGIKEFGLIDFEKSEIPRCFPEMDRLFPQCQYNNCSHTHEPGCAVKEALKSGEVSWLRYNSYLSILND
ncbi:MAG: ribosome small subunit-dependent GTPase A [Bacteroidetes bacterium]|nr:ribosome small subunit-dependent GTPase A [Bacteroidota bacterium]